MQIVFIHGSGGFSGVWHYQTQAFPGSDAIDLPGHPDGELLPTVEACTDWLKAYVDTHGYSDVVLVGHSIGGAIAMQYALQYPEDLAALVLVGSGARLRVLPETVDGLRAAIDDPARLAPILRYTWKHVERELRNALIAKSEILGARPFVNDFEACDRFDVIDRLAEIAIPTLALCGSADVMTPPRYSQFLAEKIPCAQLEIIDSGTHMVFLEQPTAVNQAIEGFSSGL